MRAYRQTKIAITSALVLFIFFSHIALPSLRREEVFPIFTWALFVETQSLVYEDFVLQVNSSSNQKLKVPCLLQDCNPGNAAEKRRIYYLVQGLGQFWEEKNFKAFYEQKKILESQTMRNEVVSYSLLRRRYNPIDFVLRGTSMASINVMELKNEL